MTLPEDDKVRVDIVAMTCRWMPIVDDGDVDWDSRIIHPCQPIFAEVRFEPGAKKAVQRIVVVRQLVATINLSRGDTAKKACTAYDMLVDPTHRLCKPPLAVC